MADALLRVLRESLPEELVSIVEPYLQKLENGQYEDLLQEIEARQLLGHEDLPKPAKEQSKGSGSWQELVQSRVETLFEDRTKFDKQIVVFCIGYAALLAFLQSNVTGPPLPFSSAALLLPAEVSSNKHKTLATRQELLAAYGIDGVAAYKLTPNIELLSLATAVVDSPLILDSVPVARWAKLRVGFMHQRLLSEVAPTLQSAIYKDLLTLEDMMLPGKSLNIDAHGRAEFLIERSTVHTHHGFDKLARADLDEAAKLRQFAFALTGLLGKRTKFQQKDISQLVVLASSHEAPSKIEDGKGKEQQVESEDGQKGNTVPTNIDLNDDTLLESISFADEPMSSSGITSADALPERLANLDPSNQPQLDPTDSSILLSFASSITNTSPSNGLTREETLPYATRVLDGGSSNWQVYTQALLVRSRIEGYKARTVERGLLQLQALVDQVIADTASAESIQSSGSATNSSATFLPKAKESESAPATERLRYIFQLASPTRWDLEAELAQRWVQLGGLRSALDIFERLEMWAEAALCWAATEREDKAKKVVRRQLFHRTNGGPDTTQDDVDADDDETWEGPVREPPPTDAPRLYCILGDLDNSPELWEKAWEVSDQRYARAQRSIGRYYLSAKDYLKAAAAYSKSLKVNQLNHQSWFALGCVLLELAEYERAAEAFSRCVQLDDTDAEAWSNFAAALLNLNPSDTAEESSGFSYTLDDEEDDVATTPAVKRDPQKYRLDALKALKRAASLKHDSYRIWQNVLIVAASLHPPDYTAILSAQKRVLDLRGKTDGEKAIDVEVLDMLVQHVIASGEGYDPTQPGLPRMLVKFVDDAVVPLITASATLWRMVGKLALWRGRPSTALDAEEKAWRAVTSQPGWETANEARWDEVVEATIRLCDSYESLGPMEQTEGLAGGSGQQVAKDWKFKARSAIRGILGRGKDTWEDTDGWARLQDTMAGLRG